MEINALKCGSCYWYIIHYYAKYYNDANKLKSFLEFLSMIFPCDICRVHIFDYLQNNPDMSDPFEYTVNLHNDVNQRLDKKQISLDEAYDLYPEIIIPCDRSCSEESLEYNSDMELSSTIDSESE